MATASSPLPTVPLGRGRPTPDRYVIDEPTLTPSGTTEVLRLRSRLFDTPGRPPADADPGRVRAALLERVAEFWQRSPPTVAEEERGAVLYHLLRDLVGFGPIDVPMADPEIEDISCDGVGVPLYVHHRRFGSLPTDRRFADDRELDRYVRWLAQRSGASLSLARPLLEATLPGGARLQASLGHQVTTRGSTFTIRRFSDRPLSPLDLIRRGTASPAVMAYLWLAVEAGESFMVCGGTASGKTTTLNATLQFVPTDRKVVSIEDTRELNLPHENWVPLVTRAGGGAASSGNAGEGAVDMFDLLAAALRQRPQYLAVGEVRGREAYTVFQAMATGRTCLATFHAESVSALVHRMESPPISLPRALIAALPLVLLQRQVVVDDRPARRVQSVTEIIGRDPETEELVTSPVFEWDPTTDEFAFTGESRLLRQLAEGGSAPSTAIDRELDRRASLLRHLTSATAGEVGSAELAQWLAAYDRDPDGALAAAESRTATPWRGSGRGPGA